MTEYIDYSDPETQDRLEQPLSPQDIRERKRDAAFRELIQSDPDLVEFFYNFQLFDNIRPYIKKHDEHEAGRLKEMLHIIWASCLLTQTEWKELENIVNDGLLLHQIGETLNNAARTCADRSTT